MPSDQTSAEPSDLAHNAPAWSVSELSGALKKTVEEAYDHVRVRGEISGLKRAASGHVYLDLKDERAVLNAVCWRGVAQGLKVAVENGMEVIATGRLTTYPGRSNYQLVIERLELAGVGALMALLEKRKAQLAAEGLFEPGRKRPLPFMPATIGIVTSPTGAVIRDILHRLADRFPVHVLVWPVRVQGEGAADEIAAAIRGFCRLPGSLPRPDLLIVARGGGSIEDLWAFNEEVVLRAAAECDIPLISAVGHETDTTLIDFVSDMRAPTPTAAAEIAVPVLAEWKLTLADTGLRIRRALEQRLTRDRRHVEGLARGLPRLDALLAQYRQRFDDLAAQFARAPLQLIAVKRLTLDRQSALLSAPRLLRRVGEARENVATLGQRLRHGVTSGLALRHAALASPARLLETLNYAHVLKRGYALVTGKGGVPVTSQAGFPQGPVDLRFHDGQLRVVREGTGASPPRPRASRKPASPQQDDLF